MPGQWTFDGLLSKGVRLIEFFPLSKSPNNTQRHLPDSAERQIVSVDDGPAKPTHSTGLHRSRGDLRSGVQGFSARTVAGVSTASAVSTNQVSIILKH